MAKLNGDAVLNTVDQEFQVADPAVHKAFLDKVADRSACIGVIGLGYVGLPLILGFHGRDFKILGIDVDQEKIDALEAGESYIKHISAERIKGLEDGGRFAATTDFSRLPEADAVLICVPTPLTRHLEPEMTYVESTARAMAPHLRSGHLIVLESTTYPGTTRELMVPILEEGSGLKADKDFFVAYSPEREDPGNPEFEAQTIPKVVGAA
ncbi:MAG: NAD(P)-binding domain-containing protein, partial [Pseudomonadota bacterium]